MQTSDDHKPEEDGPISGQSESSQKPPTGLGQSASKKGPEVNKQRLERLINDSNNRRSRYQREVLSNGGNLTSVGQVKGTPKTDNVPVVSAIEKRKKDMKIEGAYEKLNSAPREYQRKDKQLG